MIANNKVKRSTEELSNDDRLQISYIVQYLYHNHDIKIQKDWFTFDLDRTFRSATPFIVTADFNQDMANIKALLSNLGLDYTPRRNENQQQRAVKKISFYLTRLKDCSNALQINGFKKVIKDYGRPFSIDTQINGAKVKLHFNQKNNILEKTVDGKLVHQVNLLEKYQPFVAIDPKQRHMNFDLHPKDLDIQFDTEKFRVKFLINRIQGFYQDDKMHINNIDALCLLN